MLVVEEDLRHCTSAGPLLHLIASLWVAIQVDLHIGHLVEGEGERRGGGGVRERGREGGGSV